jgi:Helix-turn-helix domain
LNLRHPAPKSTAEPSQALTTVNNHREPLDSGSSIASSGRKYSPHFTGDLLHPYFRADSRLLTVSDVAKRLGICAATVYKLCATGTLQHVRVLNSIRPQREPLPGRPGSELLGLPCFKSPLAYVLRPLPRRTGRPSRVGLSDRPRRPSSNERRLGARIQSFGACSGFTRVAARALATRPWRISVSGASMGRSPFPPPG